MSVLVEKLGIFADLIVRPEGSGYVAFVPHLDTYLFATADGRDLLVALRGAAGNADPVRRVASDMSVDPSIAGDLIARAIDCVERNPERNGAPAGVWLLDDVMNGMGDRCETFGMPF